MAKYLDDSGLSHFWDKIKSALNNKVDKVTGKGLSTNDYTTAEKTKLAGIASGAGVNTWRRVKLFGQTFSSDPSDTLQNWILSVGDNINIEGSSVDPSYIDFTISATDTKPSNFSTQTAAQEATVSCPSDTNYHRIRQILGLTAGKLYLVEVTIQFPANATGFRSIGIGNNELNSSGYAEPMRASFFMNVAPVSGAVTNICLTTFFTPTSDDMPYYLLARQNSGSALSVTPRYRVVQLN